MSQNDLVISNQTFPATRADITSALQAVGSTNSGATAPTTTYANMLWYDTTANILKMRAEANDAWISVGYLDQGSDTFKILDDTVVITDAGAATNGIIGDQTTGTWQAGTGTTESLVSPAKVKASVIAHAPVSSTTFGAIGTYVIANRGSNAASIPTAGGTYAGSGLFATGFMSFVSAQGSNATNAAAGPNTSAIGAGTWRAMGRVPNTGLYTYYLPATLFVRIS